MKYHCYNCDNWTDGNKIRYQLDPMGEWKWCELQKKETHEDDCCLYHSSKELNIDEKSN